MRISADSGWMQADAVLCGVADAGPSRGRFGLAPAQFADGWRGVGNALEGERPHGGDFAGELSLGDADVRRGQLGGS